MENTIFLWEVQIEGKGAIYDKNGVAIGNENYTERLIFPTKTKDKKEAFYQANYYYNELDCDVLNISYHGTTKY